jgi:murein DD-endopeptidase / murein LD-carboxypeptidase
MSLQKNLFFSLITLLSISFCGAQIVTSKKEAVKKGIYKLPEDNKKPEVKIEKTVAAVANEQKIKEIKPTKQQKFKKVVLNEKEDDDLILSPAQNYLANQIINNAMQFVGVRYRPGGSSTSGMDCSGMITAAFKIFDLKLPRSSNEMAKVGEKVSTTDAQKGDLIFFRTHGGAINHVGMIIDVINDEIKFLHSSSSQGVMVSSTKEPYFKRTFAQVNKVIKN